MAVGRHVGLLELQYIAKIVANEKLKKNIKYGDSSCSRMKDLFHLQNQRWQIAAMLDFGVYSI